MWNLLLRVLVLLLQICYVDIRHSSHRRRRESVQVSQDHIDKGGDDDDRWHNDVLDDGEVRKPVGKNRIQECS